jgi:uncharacterized protein YdcH (DUF465 family)
MYEHRIKHLEELHRVLDKRIDGLESTGVFEDITLEVLKKQRLHLKDNIAILKQKQEEQNQEQQRIKEMKASGFEE